MIAWKPCEIVRRRADPRRAGGVLKTENREQTAGGVEDRVLVRVASGDAPPPSRQYRSAVCAKDFIIGDRLKIDGRLSFGDEIKHAPD